MKSNAIDRRALRHPALHVAVSASLPLGARITDHGTLAAGRYNLIRERQQVRLVTAPDLPNHLAMLRQRKVGDHARAVAEFHAGHRRVENPERKAIEAASDHAGNPGKQAATRKQFAIQREIRHAAKPRRRHVQDHPASRHVFAASPEHAPTVQFFAHQPTGRIGSLPIAQKRESGSGWVGGGGHASIVARRAPEKRKIAKKMRREI
jgi:hypothetical protein